jgi:hypothetical protein
MNKFEEKVIERVGELLKDDIFECIVVSDAERCYIQGYKDAQKETIDKVCKWLEEHLANFFGESYIYEEPDTLDRCLKSMKKAMED